MDQDRKDQNGEYNVILLCSIFALFGAAMQAFITGFFGAGVVFTVLIAILTSIMVFRKTLV